MQTKNLAEVQDKTYEATDKVLVVDDGVIKKTPLPSLSCKEDVLNKVTSLSSSSTDTQYPSAKAVYDELETKQDNLPQVTNDRYLHTNSSTGALEWSQVDVEGAVKYSEAQSLSTSQKTQARDNIDVYSETECDNKFAQLSTLTVTMVGSLGNIPTGDTVQIYLVDGTTETLIASQLYGTTSVGFRLEKNHKYKVTGTVTVSDFYNPTPVTITLTGDSTATVEYYEISAPTTMSDVHNLIQLGLVSQVMNIGDEINVTWTSSLGTVYTNPAVVMDIGQQYKRHSDGQLVNGVRFQFKYGFPDAPQFDAPEKDLSTETTAQANVYYYGTNDNNTFTLLNYNTGDTIDYSAYTYIYHNSFRDTTFNIIKGGNNLLEYSAEHQWLNSSQPVGQWWQSTHIGDVAPTQAPTIRGFMAGFENSFLDYVLDEEFKVAKNTVVTSGGLATLNAKFRNPMLVEMYGVEQNSGEGDNKYWEGWKLFCNNAETNPIQEPSNSDCGARRIRNLENTNFSGAWLSSCNSGSSHNEWYTYSGAGGLNDYWVNASSRSAPAFVIF